VQSLLQGIEHEGGMGGPRRPPADDAPGIGVDHERHVDEAGPGRDVGKVADPQGVRTRRFELTVHPVERTGRRGIGDGGVDLLASHDALQPHDPHQPGDRAAGNRDPFPAELPPDLAHPVDVEVRLEHAPDLDHQRRVRASPSRQLAGISLPRGMGVIGRRGDRQHAADRLDPVGLPVIVDEGDHVRDRRSSSAIAK
jgi:hypothetical protein